MSEVQRSQLGLGAFIGVFTPSILTILGVIMYLRFGWVVGNAGLGGTLAIVVLSNAITYVSALSLSALATNMRVGVGGAYYLISRSVGLEWGGAIGIPLYLSQTLSVTLYAFGLAESLRLVWADAPVQWIAAAIVLVVTLVAARSTVFALKLQLPIMGLIGLSLLSFFLGAGWSEVQVPVFGPWEDGDFWEVFAVFFPAVTGILAGVSMSGDLREPERAIPRGVLGAVTVGFVVYLVVPVALATSRPPEVLRADSLVWTRIAVFAPFVMLGLWGAILSSAFGSILSAPRTLQALASDRLMPSFLGRTQGEGGEPVLALRLSGALALAAVALGGLNAVAEVVTMFFLTTYGTLNLVAGLEDLVGDISFRPRIRVPWWLAFAGAGGCFTAMFAINALASAVALAIVGGIWLVLKKRAVTATWGDLRSGMWASLARFAMIKLGQTGYHPRNWRPHILLFTRDLARSIGLARMASHFSQDRGILTLTTLLEGDALSAGPEERARIAELLRRNEALLEEERLHGYCEVVTVPELEAGILTVAQANGFGGMASNTVMFGWPGRSPERLGRLLALMRSLEGLQKSTLILREVPGRRRAGAELVVWWKGREHNGDLMLLLAHLLSLAEGWRQTRVVLKTVVAGAEEAEQQQRCLERLLGETRIQATARVLVPAEGESPPDVIRRESRQAAVVFLGLAVPERGQEESYARRILELVEGLPTTVLVRNASPFRGRLV